MYQATCEYDAAHSLFMPSEKLQLAEDKLALQNNIATAATALKTQQETAETRRAHSEHQAVNELRRFKLKTGNELALLKDSLDTIEKEEQTFLSTSKSHLDTVRRQNKIDDTAEHQAMIRTRRKKEQTELAYKSFDELLHAFNTLGAFYTTPLRYSMKIFAGQLLTISKIEIDGKWSSMAKDGKLSAHITAVIGFVSVVLDVTFDIGDIVSFFKELWTEIGKTMNNVGGTMKHFIGEGLEVAGAGFNIALVVGKEFITDADKTLDKVGDGFVEIGKDLGHVAVGLVVRAEDLRRDVVRTADEFIDDVDHTFHEAAEDIQHGAETVVREIDHAVIHTAIGVVHTVHNVAEKTEEIAHKAVDAIGDTFSDIGRGFRSLWD